MHLYICVKNFLESKKLWDVFTYLFFGALATVVNIVSFYIAFNWLSLNWPVSNFISWVASVLFAFVTNKLWVFHTTTPGATALLWEFTKFLIARIVSFGMDMAVMYLLIDTLSANSIIAKIITQVIVVIANYVFSKLFIFTHK